MKIKTFYRDEPMDVKIQNKEFYKMGITPATLESIPVIDLRAHGIYRDAEAKEFLPTSDMQFKVLGFDSQAEKKDFIDMLLFYRKRYQDNLREAKKSPCFGGHKGEVSHSHNGSGYHSYRCDLCNSRWTEDSGD